MFNLSPKTYKPLMNNKGSLFGLDARIAIAIFTLLTAVSGILIYSKVEKIRNTALIKELQSIDKALSAMQNDLKTFLPNTLTKSDGIVDFEALWDISKIRPAYQSYWNGPYYSKETRQNKRYGTYSIVYADETNNPCVYQSKECIGYVALSELPKNVWEFINAYQDESLGHALEPLGNEHLQGIVRARYATDPLTLHYKSISHKREGNF